MQISIRMILKDHVTPKTLVFKFVIIFHNVNVFTVFLYIKIYRNLTNFKLLI